MRRAASIHECYKVLGRFVSIEDRNLPTRAHAGIRLMFGLGYDAHRRAIESGLKRIRRMVEEKDGDTERAGRDNL